MKYLKTNDLISIIDYHLDLAFLLKDATIMDIYHIQTFDLNGLSSDEISSKITSFILFLRGYHFDIKIVSMNFPTVTLPQQEYLRGRIKRCQNTEHIPYLTDKLFDLEYLEKHNTDTEFYLITYTKREENTSSKELIYSLKNSHFNLSEIPLEKKEKIIFKLMNQNSAV